MNTNNLRKITVGDAFSNCIAYVKGARYLNRTVKVTDIIQSPDEDYLDIYITSDEGKTTVLWKSVQKSQVLEAEYDLNFD
jgi:hypothetical protein